MITCVRPSINHRQHYTLFLSTGTVFSAYLSNPKETDSLSKDIDWLSCSKLRPNTAISRSRQSPCDFYRAFLDSTVGTFTLNSYYEKTLPFCKKFMSSFFNCYLFLLKAVNGAAEKNIFFVQK